ncbi:MAG: glycosyltransferase family 2 protein [Chromatiales bacterium]|jgi:exo-beta-1,3-glucanase (GH17 family)/cellulose synthase/poly-beta-1,6-N-acetylglucosamine synthase-like glycosyltransferase
MFRPNILITSIIALLTIGLWALLNHAADEPPWPERVQGFSFAPMRAEHDPLKGIYPSQEQIQQDLQLLAGKAHAIRTYSVADTLGLIPQLAAEQGLNLAMGAWIGNDLTANEQEIKQLISLARRHHRNIVRVIVGNETLLREEATVEQMIDYLDRVREKVWAPVSLAEPWHVWLEYPELAEHVDYIAAHMLPYWEGIDVEQAVDYVMARYADLQKAFPDKPIVISEVGWPSNGRPLKQAVPSVANQATFLRRFLSQANQQGLVYYVMEAFDQPWKQSLEGAIGTYWGVYDIHRQPKFTFTEPVSTLPQWRELAVISALIGVLVLTFLFRDSHGLRSRGRSFLAVIAYGAATGAVWIVYSYTQQYMTLGNVLLGVLLLVGMLGVLVVLLAEAHEWAEALWLGEWRRTIKPRPASDAPQPMVSIHVPAYNEPPDMLMQTLDALAQLDYDNYEVLVIDNNTKDPQVWQPIRQHCEMLGERFRFFHEDQLDGFKAGALNLALRHTSADAQIIAAIDSDYQVSPNWLRELVSQFERPEIAVVQAPQDYRDGAESCFKAMCLAEYRGFFHIGMVTRNERNAIIQHGTMTMVRRSALEEVGGWGEWCITEDAELGLRLFERGYEATYVPHSFGRGLMPDTFIDFKKQRYRWAYGAVQILKQHFGELLKIRNSRLNAGQCYHFVAGWLPWFADGFNLLFNLAAIVWSVGMILAPAYFGAPLPILAVLPLALFVFKLLKMFFLYRRRVSATVRQSIAAALAGLALSHTIARAMLSGLVSSKLAFFRTPKQASHHGLLRALADAREETMFVLTLLLAAIVILLQQGDRLPDARIWSIVLLLQAIPYAAALLLSVISAFPRLPASLVGPMGQLRCSRREFTEEPSSLPATRLITPNRT